MKNLLTVLIAFLFSSTINKIGAQVYLNDTITIQPGITFFANDTIHLGNFSSINVGGTINSSRFIHTNGKFINTGTSGYISCPIPTGIHKTFDIGTNSNNKIQIKHETGKTVVFMMAVRDSIFGNPQNKISPITTNAVKKTWVITTQDSVYNLIKLLNWNLNDELPSFTRNNCAVSIWQEGVSNAWSFSNAASSSTPTGTNPEYNKSDTLIAIGPGNYFFGIGSGIGSSLPITLKTFEALQTPSNDVLLSWKTASEINNNYFEIQRSVDANFPKNIYKTIYKINGAGTSYEINEYKFIDEMPFEKLNANTIFYRLKHVNYDGTFGFSAIKRVKIENSADMAIKVFPNPTREKVNISVEGSAIIDIYFTVFDANGKSVISGKFNLDSDNSGLQINTSNLSSGVYLLNFSDFNNVFISRQKLVITN